MKVSTNTKSEGFSDLMPAGFSCLFQNFRLNGDLYDAINIAEDDDWRRIRNVLSPLFTTGRIKQVQFHFRPESFIHFWCFSSCLIGFRSLVSWSVKAANWPVAWSPKLKMKKSSVLKSKHDSKHNTPLQIIKYTFFVHTLKNIFGT